MLALRHRHGGLGASHAQQDIYDQIMVMAAVQLGDFSRVRQLLEARLATRIWDEGSWSAYESRARRADEAHDAAAVRAALRWAANSARASPGVAVLPIAASQFGLMTRFIRAAVETAINRSSLH